MEITKRELILTFATPLDTELNLRITRPQDGLDGESIKAAMDTIVASNVLGDKVLANEAKSAKYVIQQEQEVELV